MCYHKINEKIILGFPFPNQVEDKFHGNNREIRDELVIPNSDCESKSKWKVKKCNYRKNKAQLNSTRVVPT